MQDILQCYRILDLEPGVPAERVRRSYIELTHVWDPARYIANPVLRARAEEKRREIDSAYIAIRAFLPELHGAPAAIKDSRQVRDFTELATDAPAENSRALMGLVAGIIFCIVFAWAYYVLKQGRSFVPTPLPITIPGE